MNTLPNPELIDDENPEWNSAMFKEAKTMAELFPQLIKNETQKNVTLNKVSTTISYDADIISTFRAMGEGWEKLMNNALREWLQEHAL